MTHLQVNQEARRHPGGRTCKGVMPMALLLLPLTMWRHRRELADVWRTGATS